MRDDGGTSGGGTGCGASPPLVPNSRSTLTVSGFAIFVHSIISDWVMRPKGVSPWSICA
jgi:hypothetical protein